jgi:hypothetical protein
VRAKIPLAEVFYFLPGNSARKELDAWLMTSPLEPQEEGVVNIAARFSIS